MQLRHVSKDLLSHRSVRYGAVGLTTIVDPSEAPLTDQYFNDVVSLLHFNGDLIDKTGKNWTALGNAATTGTAKYGSNALTLDGNGDYISAADSADWTLGVDNWTIEIWVYPTAVGQSNNSLICEQATDATNYSPFIIVQASGSYDVIFNISRSGSSWAVNGANGAAMGTMNANAWNHIALVRDGSTVRPFVNGVQGTTYDIGGNSIFDAAKPMLVGGGNYASTYFTGRLDDFRFTKNVARYTADFTPTTAAFPDKYDNNTDAYWSYVTFASHCNSIARDITGKSLTAYGNAAVSTTQNKYGATAWAFDGTGDYITVNMGTDFSFGSGDFTIEFFFRKNATGRMCLFSPGTDNPSHYDGLILDTSTVGTDKLGLYVSSNGTGWDLVHADSGGAGIGATTIAANTWYHVAVVRSGTTFKVYLDGTADITATGVSGAIFDGSAQPLNFGRSTYTGGTFYLNGYIDDIRITKGYARYTANFTAPTDAFPNPSSTNDPYWSAVKFLSSFETLVDEKGHTITAGGNAAVSATQAKFGTKSLASDGTGDYIYLDGSSDYAFGTGDFTMECFIRRSATGTRHDIADFRPTSTQGQYPLWYVNSGDKVIFEGNTGVVHITGTTTIAANTWYHVALSRNAGVTRMFIDGIQEGSSYTDSNSWICGASRPAIASSGYTLGSECFNGYIDEFRITKGISRYSANFTAPTLGFAKG